MYFGVAYAGKCTLSKMSMKHHATIQFVGVHRRLSAVPQGVFGLMLVSIEEDT
jgi:hypothetical protein